MTDDNEFMFRALQNFTPREIISTKLTHNTEAAQYIWVCDAHLDFGVTNEKDLLKNLYETHINYYNEKIGIPGLCDVIVINQGTTNEISYYNPTEETNEN